MDYLFFILSVISLVIGITYAIIKTKLGKKNILLVLFIFTALSILLLFIPLYYSYFDKQLIKTLLISIHNTIRIFVIDADFEFVKDNMSNIISDKLIPFYSGYFSVLYVLGPCLTAGFLLDFLINLKSSLRIKLCFKKNYYVFSLLNEKSITLAEDIYNKDPKHTLIIFMDTNREDEEYIKLTEDVKKIKSVIFKNKIYDLDLKKLNKKTIYLFLMNDYNNTLDEEITTSLIKIVNKYKNYSNIKLYAFTNSKESELVISTIGQKEVNDQTELYNKVFVNSQKKIFTLNDANGLIGDLCYCKQKYEEALKYNTKEEIKQKFVDTAKVLKALKLPQIEVHRIYYAKNMIYSYLPELNKCLFDNESKDIQTVVIGLGNYGKLMTKTLVWYCQIPGKHIIVNCIDNNQKGFDSLKGEAPELFNDKYNDYVDGEACFKINFDKIDSVYGCELEAKLEKIPDANLIFISLGKDELNIEVACKIRSLFTRLNKNPKIVCEVYNEEISSAIKLASVKKDFYNIDYIGSIEKIYQRDTIINSNLDEIGLRGHQQFYDKPYENEIISKEEIDDYELVVKNVNQLIRNSFYLEDYNYNSSIASAIHDVLIKELGLFNVNGEQTIEEKYAQAKNEHRRWDAYVMSVGYRPTIEYNKKLRNDLGKLHHDLRNFYELTPDEQFKDFLINESHKQNKK